MQEVQKSSGTDKLSEGYSTVSVLLHFSRCASKAASPTIGDVKGLNTLARKLKSHPVKLQFWPLTGPLRIKWISSMPPAETMMMGLQRKA